MQKYRVLYDNEKVVDIVENNSSVTYSGLNVIVGELLTVQHMLGNIGINTEYITEFINNQIEPQLDYPYESRNIRVELSDTQITNIVLNEQTRPLIEWAYHVPHRKTELGVILWFVDFENDILNPQETEALLISLGAIVSRKNLQS